MKTWLSLLAFSGVVLISEPGMSASLVYDPSIKDCKKLNCSSVTLGGTVLNSAGLSSARWEIAVFANTNECLRLDETAMFGTGSDDEMVVVAPNGTVYRNDDFGGTTRPRVVIMPTPSRGWYYVTIARFNGAPDPEHDITFKFARYLNNPANPNCASPTPISGQDQMEADKPLASPDAVRNGPSRE